jgi:hypothetical protein
MSLLRNRGKVHRKMNRWRCGQQSGRKRRLLCNGADTGCVSCRPLRGGEIKRLRLRDWSDTRFASLWNGAMTERVRASRQSAISGPIGEPG